MTASAVEPAPQRAVSPYERALGVAFADLSPQLRAYFGAIPQGSVGVGSGTFSSVGSPRRWVRAALRLVGGGVLFPVWEHQVPFRVENRPAGNRAGGSAVAAVRVFSLRRGARTMVDSVTTADGSLVDTLGATKRFRVRFAADVADRGLRLRSTAVAVRIGRRTVSVPRLLAPQVTLTERASGSGLQHVTLSVDVPVLGRVYEYAGEFRYEVRPEAGVTEQRPGVDRVVIAGASGFLGTRLTAALRADGSVVQTIGRRGADATWDDPAGIRRIVDGADLLVNLAGKSVNCRYSARNRAEILRSRLDTTSALRDAVLAASAPPPLWLNASTATIYRHADDRPMTESAGELGEGFSVGIATAWEAELFRGNLPGTRRVALRTSIVLGHGSVLVPLKNLVRVGLGGPQLDGRWFPTPARLRAGTYHRFRRTRGRQRFSWIHIDDVVGVVRFLRASSLDGVVNVTSPNPSDNRTVMAALRAELGVPIGLPAFRWMLELGSVAIRTETELVLKSRWVLPERLLAAGYRFRHPELREALRDLLHGRTG